uniref:Uncharacterized protein n=1 Tax=Arundo donax TaxID=35708 RepID=A0A0A9BXU3_ARUDO
MKGLKLGLFLTLSKQQNT